VPALFRQMLGAAKQVADPRGIMNPGVLLDPVGRSLRLSGALAP
jgi:alkyldihydroxyacetonephosphate synthase